MYVIPKVHYSCPLLNWGFTSNGENKATAKCELNREWSITEVDECVSKSKRVKYL